ncbi:periplasmic heavy metal sensor [Nostoc ellipsosporum NOK]|jgi:protein CpxP|nr:periplasmic heavy metal sensor [Nostoc ellipsosporum NOK]
MNNASKNRTLLFIIAFLLLTNIAVVVYFLRQPDSKNAKDGTPPPPSGQPGGRNGIATQLQKDVGFSDQQIAQYKDMKAAHWKIAKPLFDAMQKSKDSLYELVKLPVVDEALIQQRAENIAERQKALEIQGFRHFKEVRGLCTTEQLPRYDSLLKKIINRKGKPQGGDSTGHK